MTTDQIGVVLFNLGGPSTLSEVEPFLVRLFSDREIIELPGGAALPVPHAGTARPCSR